MFEFNWENLILHIYLKFYLFVNRQNLDKFFKCNILSFLIKFKDIIALTNKA